MCKRNSPDKERERPKKKKSQHGICKKNSPDKKRKRSHHGMCKRNTPNKNEPSMGCVRKTPNKRKKKPVRDGTGFLPPQIKNK